MTLEELQSVFRFQTTKTDTYEPKDTLEYFLINGQNRNVPGTHSVKDFDGLLTQLNEGGYVFDAFRDRSPVFIVPEIIQPL